VTPWSATVERNSISGFQQFQPTCRSTESQQPHILHDGGLTYFSVLGKVWDCRIGKSIWITMC